MIKDIFIKNKQDFNRIMVDNKITDDNVETDFSQYVFISINDMNAKSHFNSDHKNVLILNFDDIVEPNETELECVRMGIYKLFENEDAIKIHQFLQNIDLQEVTTFLIHCSAGISRSGAVGTFICDKYRLNYKDFKSTNPRIHPNSRVLSMLRKSQ